MNVAIAVAAGCGVGAGISVTVSSRLLLALDIEQVSAQHGIDACIDFVLLPAQHTAEAGIAVTNSTIATVMAVAKRFVIEMLTECTMSPTTARNMLLR